MALNLHLLRIFSVVAEHDSISRAAEAMYISQPAVTKAVQELEKQLGVALIERGTRGIRLTEIGAVMQEHARAIFAAEQVAEDELRSLRGLGGGTLRVGASLTIANYYLPPLVARFQTQHPLLELILSSNNTETITSLLLDYKLDVALVEGPVQHDRIAVRKWRDDDMVVVCAAGHALAKRKRLKLSDLDSADWIVREAGSGTREVVENAVTERGIVLRTKLEMNSTAAIKQTVANSQALAFVSRLSASDQVELGKLCVLPVTDFSLSRPLNYLTLKRRALSVAARAFEKFIALKAAA